MSYTPLRDVPTKVANREPFQGNSISAIKNRNTYTVFSYWTAIARVDEQGRELITNHKYSVTTSKHTSAVRRGMGPDMIEVPHDTLN